MTSATCDRVSAMSAQRRLRPLLFGELVIVVVLIRIYDDVRSLANVRTAQALANAQDVLGLERRLHIDVELPANSWLDGHSVLMFMAGCWYQAAHLTVTLSLLAFCWWKRPAIYRAARNCLVLVNLVALGVFFLLPVMPPRLMPGMEFSDSIAEAGLGTAPVGPVPVASYAAMPSLHLAWATWVTIALCLIAGQRRRRLTRVLAAVYPVTTSLVVVVTANHFVLDIVAGVALALLSAWATGLLPAGTGLRLSRSARLPRFGRVPPVRRIPQRASQEGDAS